MTVHARTLVCASVWTCMLGSTVSSQLFDTGSLVDTGQSVSVIDLADLDLDGDLDIVLASSQLEWMENRGDLQFASAVTITSALSNPGYVLSGDVDGDGDQDVLASWPDQDILSWHENEVGSFAPIQLVAVAHVDRNFDLGDMNHDGMLDIVAPVSGSVEWFPSLGGSFGAAISVPSPYVDWVDVLNFNGDGLLDILGVGYKTGSTFGSAFWLKGDGLGGFNSAVTMHNDTLLRSAEVFDADGDGDTEPFLCSSDKIEWFEQKVGGGFMLHEVVDTALSGGEVVKGRDLDKDGDVDLVAGFSGSPLSWYSNITSVVYGSPQAISTLTSRDLDVADMDGDTDEDIVIATSTGLYVFQNLLLDANAWTVVGTPLEGSTTPQLSGHGSLVPDTIASVELSDAPPSAPAFLVLGLSAYNAPFKTGVLVPKDDLIVIVTTSAQGEVPFSFLWPSVIPSGVATYWQYWMPDVLGPEGFASSNALLGVSQ